MIKNLFFTSLIALIFASCSDHAQPNVYTIVSDDYGQNWELIPQGKAIPKSGFSYGYRRLVVPAFSMQGDNEVNAQFKGNVKAAVEISYNYEIFDAIAFVKGSKFVAQSQTQDTIDMARFENAENVFIDTKFKDVLRALTGEMNIVDFDADDVEVSLLAPMNERLKGIGVRLTFMSIAFEPDAQIKEAISASTAMSIYKSNGMEQIGEKIIVAKAGATNITK
jgi:hypothetical protein